MLLYHFPKNIYLSKLDIFWYYALLIPAHIVCMCRMSRKCMTCRENTDISKINNQYTKVITAFVIFSRQYRFSLFSVYTIPRCLYVFFLFKVLYNCWWVFIALHWVILYFNALTLLIEKSCILKFTTGTVVILMRKFCNLYRARTEVTRT